ncbi:MAG: AMED_5909 family protein [Pseudonocardiaceae bacterium]
MTTDKPTEPVMPRTLLEAHEVLARGRPARQAPLAEWLAYYQRSAALYAEVAEIDRGHHHESLYWADQQRERLKEIQAQIATSEEQRGT